MDVTDGGGGILDAWDTGFTGGFSNSFSNNGLGVAGTRGAALAPGPPELSVRLTETKAVVIAWPASASGYAPVSAALPTNVANLLPASPGATNGTGNALDNLITGGAGKAVSRLILQRAWLTVG